MNPLLVVHGFGGAAEDFTEWVPRLGALGWDVAVPQLPGHGFVQPPYGLASFASSVLGVADERGWDRFTLLGHSMGGMVAQLVALQAADRLDGLVLMGTGHGPVDIDAGMVEAGKAVVRAGGMAALVEAQRGEVGSPAHERLLRERPGYREFMDAKALAMDPDMWVAVIDELVGQPDRLDGLRSLRVATLVVVGDQDELFLASSQRLAAAIPSARLVVIPDAGHSPQFEAPDACWEAVSSFLEGVG